MAFEPHPWFIGLEGVEHSAEVARTLAWAATNGASGIITPTDLEVTAETVPSGSVRIAPGGFVVASKYATANQQSYIERNPEMTSLEVPATGSSGGATRYVVARVTDPDYPGGGTVPAVPNDGVYAAPYLVSSLSSTRTEIVLAKITQPANTAAITNAMITDMRSMANPKVETRIFARPRVTDDNSSQNWLNEAFSQSGGELFPGGNGYFNRVSTIVPEWATTMIVEADWLAVRYSGGQNVYGQYWVEYGDEYKANGWPGNHDYEYKTQSFQFDSPAAGNTGRVNWRLMDTRWIDWTFRGKEITFCFKAGYYDGSEKSGVSMDAQSGQGLKITFYQEPAKSAELN